MGMRDWLGLGPREVAEASLEPEESPSTELAPVTETSNPQMELLELNLAQAMEHIADLQRENQGWQLIGAEGTDGANRETLLRNADLVRAFSGMNPLMVRAKAVRQAYVWGGGVEITTRSAEEEDYTGQDVAEVVSMFLDDSGNQAAVFGPQARAHLEGDNFDDGNVFIGHWVNPLTGGTKVRPIPFNEITEIMTAPGDHSTPWYYLRTWTEQLPGEVQARTKKAWYPDLDFDPVTKPSTISGYPVLWPGEFIAGYGGGAAVYHVKVNPTGRLRKWGVGDGFAAMPWAKAYKGFLEDTNYLYKALAKIAHVISGTKDKAQLARAAANAANGPAGGNMYGNDVQVSNPSFNGIDTNQGRPYAAQVAAAVGLPVTVLTADPGQTGARAVAETLDKPTRLLFEARQEVWAEFIRSSVGYKIKRAVMAPRGPLKGWVEQVRDRTEVRFRDDTDPTVQVDFPSIEDDNLTTLVEAIATADATGKLPPLEVLRLLLTAFQVEDAEDILKRFTDDQGNWVDPNRGTQDAAAQAAIAAYRRGGDPADVL